MIRILLADDHAMVRDGLKALLEQQPDCMVVGTAEDGQAAVELAQQLRPDIVVLDIDMPRLNGIEAARAIVAALPGTRILMLSMKQGAEYIHRALQAGALGYLLKDSAGAELAPAIRALHARRRYLSDKISDTVLADYLADRVTESPLDRLSPRERNILQLLAEGHSNAEAAQVLAISVKTVETYRSRLMQKLGLGDVASLVKFALQHGLTQL
jgi:DNA-binding NarL/FixJ family response regulator